MREHNIETPSHVHDHNRQAWDALVRERQRFTRPAKDEDFANPLRAVDAGGWLGESIAGQRVLCLAAGGGRQAALTRPPEPGHGGRHQ